MTTPLAEIMNTIEQHRFSSELNLAAGTRAFRRGLRNHRLFLQLAEEAKNPAARAAVAKRVEVLSAEHVDTRYENRYDAALSAYLTVLADTAEPETIAKAASAAMKAVNTWWTSGISRELITHAVATGSAETSDAARQLLPASLVSAVDRPKTRTDLQKICSAYTSVTVRTVNCNQILEALRVAEMKAQARDSESNKAIVRPQPSEEGVRVVWKARGRSRAHARSRAANARTASQGWAKQLARA